MAEAWREKGGLRRLTEKPPFRATLTGSQALARAVFDTCTRTAVLCPGLSFPVYEALRHLPRQNTGGRLCEPANEKTAIHEAFRAAMAGGLTVLFCGAAQGPGIREALRQVGGLDLPGGLVLLGGDTHDSRRQGQDEIWGFGNIPDPAGPGEIYRFYRLAAGLASEGKTLVALRVASRLWAEAETVTCDGAGRGREEEIFSGSRIIPMPGGGQGRPGDSPGFGSGNRGEDDGSNPGRRQALICADCSHGAAAAAVREILTDSGVAVTAMACRGPSRHAEIGSSLPLPAPGCGDSGIRVETSGGNLLVCAGSRELPQSGELAEDSTLVIMAVGRTGGGSAGEAGGLGQKVRELGVERILSCHSCRRGDLAAMIQEAMGWQGKSAVLVMNPFYPDRVFSGRRSG